MRASLLVVGTLLLGLIFSHVSSVAAEQATSNTVKVCTVTVTGMTCAGCEVAVRHAAKTVDGVKDVKASYEKRDAEVTYDPTKTTPAAIAKVITERSGFKAVVQPDKKK